MAASVVSTLVHPTSLRFGTVVVISTLFAQVSGRVLLWLAGVSADRHLLELGLDVALIIFVVGPLVWRLTIRPLQDATATTNDELLRLRTAVDASIDSIFLTDKDGVLTYVNPAFTELYGFKPEDVLGIAWPNILKKGTPGGDDEVAAVWKAVNERKTVRREFVNRRKDGRLVTVNGSISPVLDHDGSIAAFVAIERDVTEERRARDQLAKSERELREAQRIARVGSWDWDAVADRMSASDEFVRMFGPAAVAATRDQRAREYTPDSAVSLAESVDRALRDGVGYEIDIELRPGPAGRPRWATVRGEPYHDATGRIVGVRGTLQDITERKRVGDALLDAHRQLQSLSRRLIEVQEADRRQLARELHDELGQILTAAKIALQSLERYPDAETMGRGLEEARVIIDQALQEVRSMSLQLRPPLLDDLGLHAALRWLVDQQSQRAAPSAQLLGSPSPERLDPAVETACFRIAQEAITNVIRHADAHNVVVELHQEPGAVHLRIRDDGAGFDLAEARGRATAGGSVGLLSMEERAALAGGRIEWRTSPGKGTEVHAVFATAGAGTAAECA